MVIPVLGDGQLFAKLEQNTISRCLVGPMASKCSYKRSNADYPGTGCSCDNWEPAHNSLQYG